MTAVYAIAVLLGVAAGVTVKTRGFHRDVALPVVAVAGVVVMWATGFAPTPERMTVDVWRLVLPWFAFGCAVMAFVRVLRAVWAPVWAPRDLTRAGFRRLVEAAADLDQPKAERNQ